MADIYIFDKNFIGWICRNNCFQFNVQVISDIGTLNFYVSVIACQENIMTCISILNVNIGMCRAFDFNIIACVDIFEINIAG